MSILDDLKAVDGLTDEQTKQLGDMFGKLKENHDSLLAEKKTLKTALQNSQDEFDAHKNSAIEAEENAKIEKAKAEKDIEGLQAALLDRDNRIKAQAEEVQQKESARVLEGGTNEFLAKISDDPAHRHFMSTQFQGGVEVKEGKLIGKDGRSLEDFTGSLLNDEKYAGYVKANIGSGGGANGSDSAGGAGGKTLSRADLPSDPMARAAAINKARREGVEFTE